MFPAHNALSVIRVNLLGYSPRDLHVAVLCSLEPRSFRRFRVINNRGSTLLFGVVKPKRPAVIESMPKA